MAVVNDRGDYDPARFGRLIADGIWPQPGSDSLVSYAEFDGRTFTCGADYWGLNAPYYFHDGTTFVCSNNAFLPAKLLGLPLSRESLWEYLFFISPMGDRSWFEGLSRLHPGQALCWSPGGGEPRGSAPAVPLSDLLSAPTTEAEMVAEVRSFAADTCRTGAGRTVALAFSAGPDSRCVLSLVRGGGMAVRTFTFVQGHLRENQQVRKLLLTLGLDGTLVEIAESAEGWLASSIEGTQLSSGALNPFRTHLLKLYAAVPGDYRVTAGILGSEFMKGIQVPGVMAGRAHIDVIQGRGTVEEVIARRFPHLSSDAQGAMAGYLRDAHGDRLLDVNTDAGYRAVLSILFETVPARFFSGEIQVAGREHDVFYPFLSPRILRAVFGCGGGVPAHLNLRRRYPSFARVARCHALIARELDPQVYGSRLSKNLSFAEILARPSLYYAGLRKVRNLLDRWQYRHVTDIQVDKREARALAADLVAREPLLEPAAALLDASTGNDLLVPKTNIVMLQRCRDLSWDVLTA
jgi:hypothetical protein